MSWPGLPDVPWRRHAGCPDLCEHEFTENLENHQVRCEKCGLVVGGCTTCVAEGN